MRRYLILSIALAMAFLSGGCNLKPETVEPKPGNSVSPQPSIILTPNVTPAATGTATQGEISFYHAGTTNESVTFEARTDLPSNTIMLSQLYVGSGESNPEIWWPCNQEFVITNGKLTILVDLGKNGAPAKLSNTVSYHLKVWSRDNPEIKAQYYFDLIGPLGAGDDIQFTGSTDKASYMTGQVVNATLTLTNKSSGLLKVNLLGGTTIMPFLSTTIVRHLAPGIPEFKMQAGETDNYSFSWDQKDDNGEPVAPGWYIMKVDLKLVKEPDISAGGRGAFIPKFLIQYPKGAMEKSIEVNQSQTVNGVTVALRHIEMTTSGTSIDAFVNSTREIVRTPPYVDATVNPAYAEYSTDGKVKNAGAALSRPEGDGIGFAWMVDPLAGDARTLSFTITTINKINGPWKFLIALQ